MDIDVSLLDGQVAMLPYVSAYHFLDGYVPGPQGSGGHAPTYRAFKCADGRYVVIAVSDQKSWRRLCKAVDELEIGDTRFSTPQSRQANSRDLETLLERAFESYASEEWCKRLEGAGVAYSRVNRLDETLSDPQVIYRKMIIPVRHRSGATLQFVATPTRLPGFNLQHQPPPRSGENTDAVLREFGVPPEIIMSIVGQKDVA